MKIALLMENSQADKNPIIEKALKEAVEPQGHTVFNLGMYNSQDDHQLTYIQLGIISSILLNSKTVDFIVTGCGTGQGACMSLNSFPGVCAGLILNPTDAFLFSQINAGNAVCLPYAQGFGWGAEVNLKFTFEKLFAFELGLGYPLERAHVQQCNAQILSKIKHDLVPNFIDALKNIDQQLLKSAIQSPAFQSLFFKYCQDEALRNYISTLL